MQKEDNKNQLQRAYTYIRIIWTFVNNIILIIVTKKKEISSNIKNSSKNYK